jgi:TolB-like protein/Flp pilus assembly protein TadD
LPTSHHGFRYEFDDVVVDAENYRVYKGGDLRPIGPRAFDLLLDLLANAGRVVDKQELFDRVWQGAAVTDNALTRAVRHLRQVIGDEARAPRYIETVARRGYRFVAHARQVPASPKARLAVLPFDDLSPTPEDYFTDGLVEELITQLGQANPERLAVIARASAMSYRTSSKRWAEIGRELAVDYVLQGSVRRACGRVRISVQLARVSDQCLLWATSYDAEIHDILWLQEGLAEAATQQIHVRLVPSSRQQPERAIDPDAWAAYLKGRYYWSKRSSDGIDKAMRAFEDAVARAPAFARAHVGLARCHATFVMGLRPRSGAEPLARAAVGRALDLDDRLAEAHATLGLLQSADWDFTAAERTLRWAGALDPNDPGARHWLAMFPLVVAGRFDEALDELRRAQQLDPLSLIVSADMAAIFYLTSQFDRAIAQCGRVLDRDPHFARAHLYRGWALAAKGQTDTAVDAVQAAVRIDGSPWTMAWLGYTCALAGHRAEAARILEHQLRLIEPGRGESSYLVAVVYSGLGEVDAAVTWFERAFAERSFWLSCIGRFPAFDELRQNARFQDLLRRTRAATWPSDARSHGTAEDQDD